MHRKEFIKACGFACLGSAFIVPLLEGCAVATHYGQTTIRENELVVSKSEFLKASKDGKQSYRRYIILKNDKLEFPVYLHRLADNDYKALLMLCTHQGCELQLQGDFLLCPCHGSEFNNMGIVQNPPAQENLKTFTIRTDNESIYITI